MFKKLRDQIQAKYSELMGEKERADRELHTKRAILGDFEDMRKQEVTQLKEAVLKKRVFIAQLQMAVEDLSSDMWRLKDAFNTCQDELEVHRVEVTELKQYLEGEREEKHELCKELEQMQHKGDRDHSVREVLEQEVREMQE